MWLVTVLKMSSLNDIFIEQANKVKGNGEKLTTLNMSNLKVTYSPMCPDLVIVNLHFKLHWTEKEKQVIKWHMFELS